MNDGAAVMPIDIARLALKQLAYSKVPPTPDNFRKVYDDIAGVRSRNDEYFALGNVIETMLRNGGHASLAQTFHFAVIEQNWAAIEATMKQLPLVPGQAETAVSAVEVLHDLLDYLELDSAHPAIVAKVGPLEQLLQGCEDTPAAVLRRIRTALSARAPVDAEPVAAAAAAQDESDVAMLWRDLLIEALELGLLVQFEQTPRLKKKTRALLEQARQARSPAQLAQLGKAFGSYWKSLAQNAEVQTRFHASLLKLFQLLVENMSLLTLGDHWLHGQIRIVREIIDKPLDQAALQDAESKLEALLQRQGLLKRSLQDAKQALKQMAVDCIEMLATVASQSGDHHDKIKQYQVWINDAQDLLELNAVLENLRHDMQHMQEDVRRTFEALKASHEKVLAADQLIDRLSLELDQASELAAKDFLTGALNRRGAEDALEREFARSDRTQRPVCVALLDIDHFKHINDTYGHETGDEAICHLVDVARGALRPADLLARYGGEEFLIILPETDLSEGVRVLTRLQRELTKQWFLRENERVLITFSAGVAERIHGEDAESVIMRADRVLYDAKNSGRNRVVGA